MEYPLRGLRQEKGSVNSDTHSRERVYSSWCHFVMGFITTKEYNPTQPSTKRLRSNQPKFPIEVNAAPRRCERQLIRRCCSRPQLQKIKIEA
jgi:hypothetical protein